MVPALSIPKQYEGAQSDICHTVTASTIANAEVLYEKAKENLLHVNRWGKLAGGLSAKFQLVNDKGDALYRPAKEQDYIKIKLPVAGKNYDWVKIESIKEVEQNDFHQQIIMRVRPTESPENRNITTEHFLTDDATSNFSIERKGEKITASVHGRNELPNTHANGFINKIRNTIIALFAMIGLNTPQWKALAKGLVTKTVSI